MSLTRQQPNSFILHVVCILFYRLFYIHIEVYVHRYSITLSSCFIILLSFFQRNIHVYAHSSFFESFYHFYLYYSTLHAVHVFVWMLFSWKNSEKSFVFFIWFHFHSRANKSLFLSCISLQFFFIFFVLPLFLFLISQYNRVRERTTNLWMITYASKCFPQMWVFIVCIENPIFWLLSCWCCRFVFASVSHRWMCFVVNFGLFCWNLFIYGREILHRHTE